MLPHTTSAVSAFKKRCPVVPLSLRLKRESELQAFACVLMYSTRRNWYLCEGLDCGGRRVPRRCGKVGWDLPVESTEGISEIWFQEPFPRWGFLRFRVRVSFTDG